MMSLINRVGLLGLCMVYAALAWAVGEPLPPEQAYRMSAQAVDGHTVEVRFDIVDGYYLYQERFKFRAEPESVQLGAAQLPAGKEKDDDNFGKVHIYRGELLFRVPVQAPADTPRFTLTVIAQGCADIGICYPPTPQSVAIDLSQPVAASVGSGDESARVAALLGKSSLWWSLLSFFGFGVLLALTPCCFPMIPILSGIIVGQGHEVSKGRSLFLSLVYVLTMALTYALAGVAAGLSGSLLSAALQNAWVLGSFAALFVLLSLSMFGFYELQMPAFLQSRLSETSSHQQGGSVLGVAVMGLLSALIVGPCVAAPLAGALLYIAKTHDAVLGGSALFAMGLGMGAPLVLVALFTRQLLPRSGAWMEAVKKFFGVLLLGVAIWLVSPVLPAAAHMLAWAALLIISAIYVHALDPLPPHASGWARFWKGTGVLALLLGAAMLIGVLGGSRDPLQPLSFLRSAAAAEGACVEGQGRAGELRFERVATVAELERILHNSDRGVMLDYYADWCVSCKEMDRFTFSDPSIRAKLNGLRLLRVDVTANSEADKALLARAQLFGPPGILFFNRAGQELSAQRVVGFQDVAQFGATLDGVLAALR